MTSGLSQQQVSEFKRQLEQRFRQLREEIRQELLKSDDEQYVALAGRVHDAGEESTADLLADVNLAIIDRHINEIREIDAALMRIAKGTFGVCVDCEADIAYERLRAYATAMRCHDCQARYEHSHPQPGRSSL